MSNERPTLSVIGTGYLGATHAVCMVELGYDVIGMDVDEDKIKRLQAGEVPFYEPGLPELLAKHIDGGRLRFTTSYQEAAQADIHFVCVGTPQLAGSYAADLRYVESAFRGLAPHLTRRSLVVGKSTVPTGTAVKMEQLLTEHAPADGVELGWNPEFLREGFAVEDTLHPDRLVFGVRTGWAEQQLRAAFAPVIEAGTPVVVTDFATAELVKVAANSFLATKISFINAMAEICEVTGADVTQLSTAIGYDTRIGHRFLHAGLGFGGGCLPKDIRAFIARADELGVDQAVSFLREVDGINLRRRARTVDLGAELLDGRYDDARVAVLGAAFKPNSDDIRDSPALDVATAIGAQGAHVVVYDPHAIDNARRVHPELTYAESLEAAVSGAHLVLLLTEWDEFRTMDPRVVGDLVARRNLVDGRNVLDPLKWRDAGWHYRALGRP
ncbi:MAG: UDP-glucose/GDP-mannose dehydrogenase family protein [Actinomycetota bacterium]